MIELARVRLVPTCTYLVCNRFGELFYWPEIVGVAKQRTKHAEHLNSNLDGWHAFPIVS